MFESHDLFVVHHYNCVLDAHDIPVHVAQDRMASLGAGEAANPEFWPRLYVLEESDVEKAQDLIEQHKPED